METLIQDLRYGLRMLLKNPGFAFIAVLSLAIGIGANGAVFSLIDALLLKPLPVEKPDELVALAVKDYHTDYPHGLSYRDFLDYREKSEVVSGMAAFSPIPLSLANEGRSDRIWGLIVSGNYFSMLGVQASLGRTFLPEEDSTPGTHPVIVISYKLWQNRFGADPNLIGKTVTLNGHAFTVIGVSPKNFNGLEVIFSPDIWVPASMHALAVPDSKSLFEDRDAHGFRVWARLKPGVDFEQAQAALNIQSKQLEQAYPATNKDVNIQLFPQWEARFEVGTGRVLALASAMLMALVVLVLLIACANVANLILSRVAARHREIAIRLALGASRTRLVRQLLTEGAVLAILGGSIALLLALWASDAFQSFRPVANAPIGLDVRVDGRVIAFTSLIAFATIFLFGLAPALQASRSDLVPALKGEEMGGGSRKRRFSLRNMLVVSQIAMSLILLISAGLFLLSLRSAQRVELGLRTEKTLLASVELSLHGYDAQRGRAFYRDLLDRIRRLPGVEAASMASPVPLDFSASSFDIIIEGREVTGDREQIAMLTSIVGPGYFEAIGTPLVMGRDFTDQDQEGKTNVAVINETMARQYWPGQDPLGKRIRLNNRDSAPIEVIGVVRDGKYRMYFEDSQPYVYIPFFQRYNGEMTLVVRTSSNYGTVTSAIRQELAAIAPDIPLFGVRSVEDFLQGRTFSGPRLVSSLLSVFGLIGLILSAMGIYGVMSYFVSRRTREIGIRMALGANPRDVLRLVVGQGMALVLTGVVIGVLVAFVLARLMSSLLFGVSPADPLIFAGLSLLLSFVALLACAVPAYRATKVNPMIALRYD